MTIPDTNSCTVRKQYIEAWGRYFEEKIAAGWEGYLMTLMFNHIRGSEPVRLRVMERELERVYATHVTHVVRRPQAPVNRGRLPIWVAAPDYPIAKHAKQLLRDVTVNDGAHLHCLGLWHPERRFTGSVEDHFDDTLHTYIHGEVPLLHLQLEPIETNTSYVVGYGFKTILRRAAIGLDGLIVLPRTSSEL